MSETTERPRDRLPTGVPGLDAILHGGLLQRGVYMFQGRPGSGKTILANQICFHHASSGHRVVYATLLAETHERMFFNLEQLAFFDASRTPEQISYVSAFATLEEGGLRGLADMLRREARARRASLLVVDGLVAVEEIAETKKDFKKFIQDLQIQANLLDCTVLLLTSTSADPVGPEHTMVDGVIAVSDNRILRRSERELEVMKFRGSSYLRGGHAFQISNAGITLFPRIEALLQDPSPDDACTSDRVSTGIPDLDGALKGGLRCASSTVVFGPTGVGKTVLGLHFLSASSKAEPGLYFGFYETPPRVMMKAKTLGLDFEALQRDGVLEVMWHPPTERILDSLAHRLLKTVRERRISRLLVDGLDGFVQAAAHSQRVSHFLSALTNELRIHGVTTLYTLEMNELFSQVLQLPMQGISSLVENIILLRFMEQRGQIVRTLGVLKTRDSDYDHRVREFRITSQGAALGKLMDASAVSNGRVRVAQGAASPARLLKRVLSWRSR